jgi:aspartyl-tRNA(Asn)/glutamyl-tRNA(Gln) amidotransferase subunit C
MSDFNIQYVARLARIRLEPDEEARLGEQLGNILGYIAQLREVDVSGVEPMAHAFPVTNVSRADEVQSSLSQEDALGNAPAKASGLFVVPTVIE